MNTKNLIGAVSLGVILGCGKGANEVMVAGYCGGYPEPSTSPYKLPYAAGQTFKVIQGNCTQFSHFGDDRYSYDIEMPMNTQIIAMQAGTVIEVKENGTNYTSSYSDENNVTIQHADGTVGRYVHMTTDGVQVNVGDAVTQGQNIALSGSSGTPEPHLHITLFTNSRMSNSIPLTFRNTSAHPGGLQEGANYTAQ